MRTDISSTLQRGATLLEVLIVTSILSVLGVIGICTYGSVHEALLEAECRGQLAEIGSAIVRYREDHRHQDPPSLSALAPDYVSKKTLVCPVVRERVPEAVAKLEAATRQTPRGYWSSYFRFSRQGLDRLYQQGQVPVSYSEVLRRRQGDTPVAVCFDHREPDSLYTYKLASPEMMERWYSPERPQISPP